MVNTPTIALILAARGSTAIMVSHIAAVMAYVGMRMGEKTSLMICAAFVAALSAEDFMSVIRYEQFLNFIGSVVSSQACDRLSETFTVLGYGAPGNIIALSGKCLAQCLVG